MCVKELDLIAINSIAMFVQQVSNKVTVRQTSVMLRKCQHVGPTTP